MIEITINAMMLGRKIKAYEFTFAIEGSDKAQGYYEEIENDELGKANFSKLEFKELGTYSYNITEINTGDRKIKYDKTVYILEVIIEMISGNPNIRILVDGVEFSKKSIVLNFVNATSIYKEEPLLKRADYIKNGESIQLSKAYYIKDGEATLINPNFIKNGEATKLF